MGNFCPLTNVVIKSTALTPVWMKFEGNSLEYGLIAAPVISLWSPDNSGPLSNDCPNPFKILPFIFSETFNVTGLDKNLTLTSFETPEVPSNNWTTTLLFEVSKTWPNFFSPWTITSTNSLYPTGWVFSTKINGPATLFTVLYSFFKSTIVLYFKENKPSL